MAKQKKRKKDRRIKVNRSDSGNGESEGCVNTSHLPQPSPMRADENIRRKRKRASDLHAAQSPAPSLNSASTSVNAGVTFPFATHADDHCESPLEAYRDIVPVLDGLRFTKQLSHDSLSIYDPYFCNGATIDNLKSLGFPNVYNKKEDCYAVWSASAAPNFEMIITNPPYSEDHIERLVRFVATQPKPWCLLLPQWVHKKEYYARAVADLKPFYLVPHKRYVYIPPAGFREATKSDVHKKSSPWTSMWYCWGGTQAVTDRLLKECYKNTELARSCDIARSKSALRDLRRKKR